MNISEQMCSRADQSVCGDEEAAGRNVSDGVVQDYILEPVIHRPDQIVPAPVEVLPTPPLPKMTPEASGGSKSPVPSTTVPEAEPLVSTDSTLDTTPVLRRSSRIRRAPDRLRYE
ncbi:uncharacterized protein LOC123508690 [Portunus trituberculatus]|uniref:uncharacterized protein LOC123508690 n=1 Tax=Portunus trituberculatus TaxID=210409 RepID=UPI001E1D1B12|nr:uncharacterized protein LOC123508690 [Portunus trituberculatus]